jgi:phosphatidylinositol glycan class A protein
VLRASLDPLMVSVIPNAVVGENFNPLTKAELEHKAGPHDTINIVVISRLFYNKGTDLLIAAIPRICAAYPFVNFIIAGAGPKAIDLEQMIETNVLQERVEMLGAIRHEEVRDVMVRGQIYLHPSLTEAFGTVIVEAASCGLHVVCTRVGGIPEVLPLEMTSFANPEEDDIVAVTSRAIDEMRAGRIKTDKYHELVKTMYSWTDIAARTERLYDGITGLLREDDFYGYIDPTSEVGWSAVRGRADISNFSLIDRLKRYYGCGIWAGKLFCICMVVDYLLLVFLEFFFPRSRIDIARDWPRKVPTDDMNEYEKDAPS